MKYLITYEDYDQKEEIKKLHQLADNYKIGDCVVINCKDLGVDNEVMVITHIDKHSEGFTVCAYKLDDPNKWETYYDYEIVRNLTPEEANFYKSTKKFNL